MHSDLRFNPSSALCINLDYIILFYIILYYVDPLFRILGCNVAEKLLLKIVMCHIHDRYATEMTKIWLKCFTVCRMSQISL